MGHLAGAEPRSLLRRCAAVLSLVVLAALLSAPPASAAAVKRSVSLSATLAGAEVALSGRVTKSPKGTKVILQVSSGGGWSTVAKVKTGNKKGSFAVSVGVAPGTHTFRATVKRTTAKVGAKKVVRKLKAATSPVASVTVAPTPGPGPQPGPDPDPDPDPVARGSIQVVIAHLVDNPAPVDFDAADVHSIVTVVSGWFATQTDGAVAPSFVSDDEGRLSVVHVDVTRTGGRAMAEEIEAALGGYQADRHVLAFPDFVPDEEGCGTTFGDSAHGGMWFALIGGSCGIVPDRSTWPYGATYLTAHELTHLLGAVPACAPHQSAGGHVSDSNADILYAGPDGRDWDNLVLDAGRDDYYAAGLPGCPGIEDSPFWTGAGEPVVYGAPEGS